MKVLHILRSEPDEMVRKFMDGLSEDNESSEVALHKGGVDYDELLESIFESDKVISWW